MSPKDAPVIEEDARGTPPEDPFWERFAVILSVIFLVNVVFLILNWYFIRYTNKKRLKQLLKEEGLVGSKIKVADKGTKTEEFDELTTPSLSPDLPALTRNKSKTTRTTTTMPTTLEQQTALTSSLMTKGKQKVESSDHTYEEIPESSSASPTPYESPASDTQESDKAKVEKAVEKKVVERMLAGDAKRAKEKADKKKKKKRELPSVHKEEEDLSALFQVDPPPKRVTRSSTLIKKGDKTPKTEAASAKAKKDKEAKDKDDKHKEAKAKDDKHKETKVKEAKAKEDNPKEDKAKEAKAKEAKAKEAKAKETKAKEAKAETITPVMPRKKSVTSEKAKSAKKADKKAASPAKRPLSPEKKPASPPESPETKKKEKKGKDFISSRDTDFYQDFDRSFSSTPSLPRSPRRPSNNHKKAKNK